MERAKPFLKPVALVCSVFLVGALVGYRAGAFQRPTAQADPPAGQPELQPAAAAQPAPQSPPVVSASDLTFMGGSKSMYVFTPGQQGSLPPVIFTPDQPNTAAPPIPPARP